MRASQDIALPYMTDKWHAEDTFSLWQRQTIASTKRTAFRQRSGCKWQAKSITAMMNR